MAAQNPQDLSSAFNAVKERISNFSAERQQLVRTLEGIIRNAQQLLNDLGEGAGRRGGRGRGAAGRAGGRRKRRKLSAEARAKIAAAQRARWARHRAGKK